MLCVPKVAVDGFVDGGQPARHFEFADAVGDVLLENHEIANGFRAWNRRESFKAGAIQQDALRNPRQREFQSCLSCLTRGHATAQKSQHIVEMRVRASSAKFFSGLQRTALASPASADFFFSLVPVRDEPHASSFALVD